MINYYFIINNDKLFTDHKRPTNTCNNLKKEHRPYHPEL